jgi:hypothetical protein
MHNPYDRSSKWLIQHHGDSLLRLGGLRDVRSWGPLQAAARSAAGAIRMGAVRLHRTMEVFEKT